MRIFKIIILSLAILLLLPTALLISLLFDPGLLINKSTFKILPLILSGYDISLTYDDVDISVKTKDLAKKHIHTVFKNICLISPKNITTCFKDLNAQFTLALFDSPTLVPSFGPLIISDGIAHWHPIEAKPSKEKTWDLSKLKQTLSQISFNPITIENVAFQTNDIKVDINAIFTDFDDVLALPVGHLNIKGNLKNNSSLNLSFQGSKTTQNENYRLQAKGLLRSGKAIYIANIHGSANPQTLQTSFGLKIDNPTTGIDLVDLKNCHLNVDLGNKPEARLRQCILHLKRNRFEREKDLIVDIPRDIFGDISGTYHFTFEKGFTITQSVSSFTLRPLNAKLYKVTGGFELDLHGPISATHRPIIKINAASALTINRFEQVIGHLKNTRFAIPAPFNTLTGSLACDLEGAINLQKSEIRIPQWCTSNLASSLQVFKVHSQGEFIVNFLEEGIKTKIISDIFLENIKTTLPHFYLQQKLPPMRPDPRFIEKSIEEYTKLAAKNTSKKSIPISYDLRIKTLNPTKILVPTFRATVPLDISLHFVSAKPVRGQIKAHPFNLSVINKPVRINHFNLVLEENASPQMDALLTLERADHNLMVAFYGHPSKPRINISSDPPRPEEELMSSLIYGQGFSNLNTNEQQNIAASRAAIADNAIGFLSMLYLASTPIESIGYNSHSGEFHAQVKLQKGASLTVGSDFESSQRIGLSKRLGGNWSFETFAENQLTDDTSRGVAMLKWAKRY